MKTSGCASEVLAQQISSRVVTTTLSGVGRRSEGCLGLDGRKQSGKTSNCNSLRIKHCNLQMEMEMRWGESLRRNLEPFALHTLVEDRESQLV